MLMGGPHLIPEADYRADPGINISALKHMRHSPAKARHRIDAGSRPSPAQTLGTAIHMAILEPDRFFESYALRPDVDARTKAGKEALAEAQTGGKELLTKADFEGALTLAARVREHDFYRRFVEGGVYESSWFAAHHLGLRMKGRLDVWLPEKNVIVDLKTCDLADERVFAKDAIKYGYHCQAAWYMDLVAAVTGKPVEGYVILALEKSEDRDLRAFWLDPELIERGREDYKTWLSLWWACEQTGCWPGYEPALVTLTAPRWMLEPETF